MIVSDVVTAVRNRLGDSRKERWTDEQLTLYVSLCQTDICIFTNFHRSVYYMPVYDNNYVYNLPTDCIRVERLEYNCQFFPIESRNAIDSGTATIPCALKDNMPYGKLELYLGQPCEEQSNVLEDAYGIVSSAEGICDLLDAYGVTSSIQDELNPVPPRDAGVNAQIGLMTVYYSAVPPIVSDLTSELILPDMWITAFIHYVCGMALQDDNDANNIQRGDMEMKRYQRLLQQIFNTSAKDFTTNVKSKLVTQYRRT